MEPDISLYRDRIESLCTLAGSQNMKLRPEQVREAFEDCKVDSGCMPAILRYLYERGIQLETMITPDNVQEDQSSSGALFPPGSGTSLPLTEQDRKYLEEYVAGLYAFESEGKSPLIPYMEKAVRIAAEMNCSELPLADLIQEANLAVLTMSEQKDFYGEDPELFCGRIREALDSVIRSAGKVKSEDNILVDKVTRFEQAVREINESGGEKFSIAELAVLLEMDVEEIKDILRLTGDGE